MCIKNKKIQILSLIFLSLFVCMRLFAANEKESSLKPLPIRIQAGFCLQILNFLDKPVFKEDISIHVINYSNFAAEMKKTIGRKIGNVKIAKVTESYGKLPDKKPTVIYLDYCSNLKEVLSYCKKNKIITITGNPLLVSIDDVVVGTGVEELKPVILLKEGLSKVLGLKWKSKFYKMVKIVK